MKKHRGKQGMALLLSMAMFCALPRFGFRAEAAGGADAYWASFARDSGNAAVAESKLPIWGRGCTRWWEPSWPAMTCRAAG